VQLFDYKPLASSSGICCIRFALVAMALGAARMEAQVIIGGTSPAKEGTLLDLNSDTKGGLLLSNVYLNNLTEFPESFPGISGLEEPDLANAKDDLKSAIIYNTNPSIGQGKGIYEWNGTKWNYYVSGRIEEPTETRIETISTTTPIIIGKVGELEMSYVLSGSSFQPTFTNKGSTPITVLVNIFRSEKTYGQYGYDSTEALQPGGSTNIYIINNNDGLYYRIWIYNPEIDKVLEFETFHITTDKIMIRYISKGD
jgi:hypothetical protein